MKLAHYSVDFEVFMFDQLIFHIYKYQMLPFEIRDFSL